MIAQTLQEIASAYLEVNSRHEIGELRQEMQALLRDTTGAFDQTVAALFHPGIDLDHFAPNSKQFFKQLDELVRR